MTGHFLTRLILVIRAARPPRPWLRLVAPICLVDGAPYIVSPRTRDCDMLFKHQTRMGRQERIPAVVHLDESARLQTIPGTLSTKSPRYSSNIKSSGTFGCSATRLPITTDEAFSRMLLQPFNEDAMNTYGAIDQEEPTQPKKCQSTAPDGQMRACSCPQ